jgi:poly(beta-D-mannuronate) lyase
MKKSLLFIAILFAAEAIAQNSITSLPEIVKNAKPGDTLVIPNGIYKDVQLNLVGKGIKDHPIVIIAQTPGKVKFTNNSYIKLAGEYVELSGFYFTEGYAEKSPVIEFRQNNETLANNCRVTNCAIENYSRPERFNTDSWIVLWGKNNRIDHCTIGDKLNGGTTLIINLDDERSQENFHSIDSNYFKGHSRLGSNGGETIRVGVSRYSLTSSKTQIHHNYFEKCNGEVEIISVKSGENTINNNTFFECEGGLVLRHGSKNNVHSNIFIGNNKLYTGGVRVINPGHKVYNNLFFDLAGDRFRSALGVLNGVPNSALNRYFQVKDAEIYSNTFINCKNIIFGAGKDAERTLAPENVKFHHNYIESAANILFEDANKDGGIIFSNNYFKASAKPTAGFQFASSSNKTSKVLGDLKVSVAVDPKTAGADLNSLSRMDDKSTGAVWLRSPEVDYDKTFTHKVSAQQSKDLQKIISKARDGDIIELTNAFYELSNTISINKSLTIRSSAKTELVNVAEKGLPAFFVIENGGSLKVSGIRFNSAYKSYGDVQSAISTTTKPMNQHYTLYIDGCEFYNFNEGNYACIRGMKSTYADNITILNSIFRNNAGTSIEFAAEKEDKGIYNVEELVVKNCFFANNLSGAINVYRGGNDESTTGPTVTIDQCTFSEVENREQGCVIKLLGVQTASITNSVFNKSGAGGRVVWFEEMSWDNIKMDYCSLYQSGRIGSFYNKVAGKHIYNLSPQFADSSHHNYTITNPQLKNKSSNGKTLGANLQ